MIRVSEPVSALPLLIPSSRKGPSGGMHPHLHLLGKLTWLWGRSHENASHPFALSCHHYPGQSTAVQAPIFIGVSLSREHSTYLHKTEPLTVQETSRTETWLIQGFSTLTFKAKLFCCCCGVCLVHCRMLSLYLRDVISLSPYPVVTFTDASSHCQMSPEGETAPV